MIPCIVICNIIMHHQGISCVFCASPIHPDSCRYRRLTSPFMERLPSPVALTSFLPTHPIAPSPPVLSFPYNPRHIDFCPFLSFTKPSTSRISLHSDAAITLKPLPLAVPLFNISYCWCSTYSQPIWPSCVQLLTFMLSWFDQDCEARADD